MKLYLSVLLSIVFVVFGSLSLVLAQSNRSKNQGTSTTTIETSESKPPSDVIYKSKDVDTKVVMLSKPEAAFTRAARAKGISGIVRLRVVLSSTGEVTDIAVIKGLAAGLTDNAIQAAKLLKFKPATKDGRNVSTYATIEYGFIIDGVTIFADSAKKVYYRANSNCTYSAIPYKDSLLFQNSKEAEAAGYTKAKTKCP